MSIRGFMREPRILITGRPGIGKTTVVERALAALAPVVAEGFITKEMRDSSGARFGFEIVSLDGRSALLAQIGLRSPHRVGRYGVSLEAIESVAVPTITSAIQHADLIVMDEIGKMELLSAHFRAAVLRALRAHKPVLATISSRPHPFTDMLKQREDITLVEVTKSTRDHLPGQICAWLSGKEHGLYRPESNGLTWNKSQP